MKRKDVFVWVVLLVFVAMGIGWYMALGNDFIGVALGLLLAVCVQQLGLIFRALDQEAHR